MAPGGGTPPSAGAGSRRVRRLHRWAHEQSEALLALAAGDEAALTQAVPQVSRWTVAQHLAHLVLVDRAVLERLDRALASPFAEPTATRDRPGEAKRRPGVNLSGRLVLALGYIPRGAGRTPDPFLPEIATLAALREDLAEVRDRIDRFAGRLGELEASPARFRHFLFGELTAVQWLRFLGVHHHHHLKIVRDIRRGQRGERQRGQKRRKGQHALKTGTSPRPPRVPGRRRRVGRGA